MKILIIITIAIVLFGASRIAESVESFGQDKQITLSKMDVEGVVLDIDITPMFVDGPAILHIRTDESKTIIVYVSACEGTCSIKANNILHKIKIGDRILAKGQSGRDGSITIYDDERHLLRILQQD